MTMFGRAIERMGALPYQLRWHQAVVVNLLPKTFRGTMLWVAALTGEEIFDATQRRVLEDSELQPMISRLMRIHVTEESRHIRLAREGVRRRVAEGHRTSTGVCEPELSPESATRLRVAGRLPACVVVNKEHVV